MDSLAHKTRAEYHAKWKVENRELYNEYQRKWRKANKDKVRKNQETYWRNKGIKQEQEQSETA
jgi:hypothetical protein